MLCFGGRPGFGGQKEAESCEQFPGRPWGASRVRVSSWQPDVSGQVEGEINWCQWGWAEKAGPQGAPGELPRYRREGGETER